MYEVPDHTLLQQHRGGELVSTATAEDLAAAPSQEEWKQLREVLIEISIVTMPIKVPSTSEIRSLQGMARFDGMDAPQPSMFAGRQTQNAAKMEAFRKLKPICVPLMGIHSLSPSQYSEHLTLLTSLHEELLSFSADSLDDIFGRSLVNYVVYPLTHLIQRNPPTSMPERILEEILLCLAFLVERWKRTDEGIDVKAWEQFWILTTVILGGSPGAMSAKDPEDKGKRKELSDELKLACLGLLSALLNPHDGEDAMSVCHPSEECMDTLFSSKALTPMLFHTIATLLEMVAPPSPNLEIKISSMSLLQTLVTVYLRGRNEMLASVMPGATSTLLKTVTQEGKLLNGQLGRHICELLGDLVLGTVKDTALVRLGVLKEEVTRLDQLVDDFEGLGTRQPPASDPPDPASSSRELPRGPAFPSLTAQYVAFTQTQLSSAFRIIFPALRSHSSPIVRIALTQLCKRLILGCNRSLPLLFQPLLSTLLHLSQDNFDDVRHMVKDDWDEIFAQVEVSQRVEAQLKDILADNISAFPRYMLGQSETKVLDCARIITALSQVPGTSKLLKGILGPDGGVQRWGWALLGCLELGRREVAMSGVGLNSPSTQGSGGRLEWTLAAGSAGAGTHTLMIGDAGGDSPSTGAREDPQNAQFPDLSLRFVEGSVAFKSIAKMLISLGESAGDNAIFAIEHFLAVGKAKRNGPEVARAASALWVVDHLLRGVAKSHSENKGVRRLARSIVQLVVLFDDEDEDAEMDDEFDRDIDGQDTSEALIPVEHTKGLDAVGHLLKKETRSKPTAASAAQTRKLHMQAHRALVTALTLSLMSVSAEILGPSFRPLLLSSLYVLLSHLASPQLFLRTFAEISLVKVAYHSGYASPQNLLMDNVDYVINIVSQRLTYKRLSPLAPLVLISMIRLVGEPIVPLVQDIVDDIFDALDDYHGYELLSSGLLAVLDTLMKVMANDSALASWAPKSPTSHRLRPPPDPATDFAKLKAWHDQRSIKAKTAVEEIMEKAPQRPWKEPKGDEEDGDEEEEDVNPGPQEEPEIPPTRAQEVCKQILEKAVFFLTHSSPFIRARVLSLMASGVPVLVIGERESDLLPVIHRAWPYILNRLKDKEPFVVTEAAALLENLAKYVGDFMSKRILDHAWPLLKVLLETQRKLDQSSALIRPGGHRSDASSFTVSHRLHLAIIGAMKYIVKEVPVADEVLWEIILQFRPFLDKNAHEEHQKMAIELYKEITRRDEDAVWVGLCGTAGEIEDETRGLEYLRQPGLDLTRNLILLGLS